MRVIVLLFGLIGTAVCGCDIFLEHTLEWTSVSGGSFMMGSPDGVGEDNEHPQHQVTVPGFQIFPSEVTVGQYAPCVASGDCAEPMDNTEDSDCNWGQTGRGDYSANCVDWDNAVAFCAWARSRLPSEAEWEYAARSQGEDISYPWGDEAPTCDLAVMQTGCGESTTWRVCSKKAGNTDQGLCDMAGNVLEWVQDCQYSYAESPPTDGSAFEEPDCLGRVVRGGGISVGLRSAHRFFYSHTQRRPFLGFRCVK